MLASTIQLIGFVDILPLSYYKELSQGIDLTPQDIDQLTRVKVESTISAVSRGGGSYIFTIYFNVLGIANFWFLISPVVLVH